jgi:hypothetical protein
MQKWGQKNGGQRQVARTQRGYVNPSPSVDIHVMFFAWLESKSACSLTAYHHPRCIMCSRSSLCLANIYRQRVDGVISDGYNQAETVDVTARPSWYSQPLAKVSTVVKGCWADTPCSSAQGMDHINLLRAKCYDQARSPLVPKP